MVTIVLFVLGLLQGALLVGTVVAFRGRRTRHPRRPPRPPARDVAGPARAHRPGPRPVHPDRGGGLVLRRAPVGQGGAGRRRRRRPERARGQRRGHQLPAGGHRQPGGRRRATARTRSWCCAPATARPGSCRCPATCWCPSSAATDQTPTLINSAYNDGPVALILTVEQSVGIPIDRYIEIGFDSFAGVVDAVGGVVIDFPNPAFDVKSGPRRQGVGSGRARRRAGPGLRPQPHLHRGDRRHRGDRPHRRPGAGPAPAGVPAGRAVRGRGQQEPLRPQRRGPGPAGRAAGRQPHGPDRRHPLRPGHGRPRPGADHPAHRARPRRTPTAWCSRSPRPRCSSTTSPADPRTSQMRGSVAG